MFSTSIHSIIHKIQQYKELHIVSLAKIVLKCIIIIMDLAIEGRVDRNF
jgi:hypothetical protein